MGIDTKPRERGTKVDLDPAWLNLLASRWEKVRYGRDSEIPKMTQAEFGQALAKAVGRSEPFSDATISRFLSGRQVTGELTKAFSNFFGLPYPICVANHPDEVVMFDSMRTIRTSENMQEIYRKMFKYAAQMAKLIKEEKLAHDELDGFLEEV